MMRRRDFIQYLSGAVVLPRVAQAQIKTAPVVGFLGSLSRAGSVPLEAGFRKGLAEAGLIDGQNISIEYRYANGQYDQLGDLAAELISRPVTLILAAGAPAAMVAKAKAGNIPVVFVAGFDPVAAGLVESLSHPGGNVTGIAFVATELGPKRLGLLRDFAPGARVFAMLANPTTPDAVQEIQAVESAAQSAGLQLHVMKASNLDALDAAVTSLSTQQCEAVLVGVDPYFMSERKQVVAIVGRSRLPAVYPFREYADAGGLMSYGAELENSYRQGGIYAARVLKGERPADLPVQQPTKYEFVINFKTAKALNLRIPPSLIALADEVIE